MPIKGGAVVRAQASHQCGPGSNPGVDTICELSLLLVLSFAPRGFSAGTLVFHSPQKPTLPNSNSIWNTWTRLNKFIWTPMCFVGKQAISFFSSIKMKGNLKCSFSNSLSPLGAQTDDIWAASQSLLTKEPCITSLTQATMSWFTKLIKQKRFSSVEDKEI